MRYYRCRLQKVQAEPGKRADVFRRDWVPELQASLEVVIMEEGVAWKVVSIDKGRFVERVV